MLVAVTGGPDADGAIAMAHAIERRYGSGVLAIQVMDTSVVALAAPLSSAFAMARTLRRARADRAICCAPDSARATRPTD